MTLGPCKLACPQCLVMMKTRDSRCTVNVILWSTVSRQWFTTEIDKHFSYQSYVKERGGVVFCIFCSFFLWVVGLEKVKQEVWLILCTCLIIFNTDLIIIWLSPARCPAPRTLTRPGWGSPRRRVASPSSPSSGTPPYRSARTPGQYTWYKVEAGQKK